MKKIGLYGGTFDPIHFGHLNLAFELMEKAGLDEVWFIPVHLNPFKTASPPTPIEHRLAMLELALQDIPQFQVKDFESKRPPPSFTFDTIEAVLAEEALNPMQRQFYLMMGEDAVEGFKHWHRPEDIIKSVSLLIGSRTCSSKGKQDDTLIGRAISQGRMQTNILDVSATDIRDRLRKGLCCEHLVPQQALAYIKEHKLYQE